MPRDFLSKGFGVDVRDTRDVPKDHVDYFRGMSESIERHLQKINDSSVPIEERRRLIAEELQLLPHAREAIDKLEHFLQRLDNNLK